MNKNGHELSNSVDFYDAKTDHSLKSIAINKNFSSLVNLAVQNKYAIAISGGSDSLALFYIIMDYIYINNIYNNPILIIVNHNFRQESKLECDFVEKIAKFYHCDFARLQINPNEKITKNKQDYARKMRYQLMVDYCKQNNIATLMTAHHLDDQRETIMMRMKRGSGVDGMSGIYPINEMNGIKIIRPLIEISKHTIVSYMMKNHHLWVEDRTNKYDEYERSIMRKKIRDNDFICDDAITLMTKKMQNCADALNFYVEQEYDKVVRCDNLDILILKNEFSLLPVEISLRILKKIFIIHGEKKEKRISYDELIYIYDFLISSKNPNNHSLQYGNFLISLNKNCFLFKKLNQINIF